MGMTTQTFQTNFFAIHKHPNKSLKQACLLLRVEQEGLPPLHVAARKGHLHEITQLLAGVSKVQAQEMANATDQVSSCLRIVSNLL